MAKPKPEPEKKPAAAAPSTTRVLPMQLQIGDRLSDETGEWRGDRPTVYDRGR